MGELYRKLTLKHLKLISTLGRELNITRASELLHTSPPGISRSLSQIEDSIGVSLFERTTRSMSLTPAGRSLFRYANIILYQLDQAQEELEGLSKGRQGKLSIGLLPAFSHDLVARAIHQLHEVNPEIKIDIRSAEPDELFQLLSDGAIDVMLSHAEFSADMENTHIHELYREESAIVCDPTNPLASRSKISALDIASSTWILPKPETALRKALNRALFVDRPVIAGNASDIEVDSYAQSLAIIARTNLLTVLPKQRALVYQKLGNIKILSTPITLLKGPMCCMTPKNITLTSSTQLFLDFLRESAPR